jgi:3-phenylpropionate/trans-cinnamate dioxygenase ferredoxin reductase component
MPEGVVIIGGGQAGGVAAASLRDQGYAGPITLVAEEPCLPYQRPPLSKNYLAGQMSAQQIMLKQPAFYADKSIAVITGTRAESIDRAEGVVRLSDARAIGYDALLLATGARPRRIDLAGASLAGVCYLRTIADVDRIRSHMSTAKRMVVIGGGYIGLEVAAVARQAGLQVTVLEATERILGRVTGETIAGFVADAHRARGVDIQCGVQVDAFAGATQLEAVSCAHAHFPADMVVVGIGVVPNTELATDAGLQTDNGISVDEYCRTQDPRIYAAGDCTNHPNALLGRRLRLESVQNAIDQARCAAANICGTPKRYCELPWFWSNQFDLRLQMAGISHGYDRTLMRGEPSPAGFSVLYLRGEVVIAADTVNAPREHLALRKLIAQGAAVDVDRLRDPANPLPA